MLDRYRRARQEFPQQFWLLAYGMLLSTIGGSMVWPFLMVYVSAKLALPLAVVTSLMTFSSIVGIVFSFVAGTITDRVGRKGVMVISLLGNAVVNLLLSQAGSYASFAVLMALQGMFNPLYRVGADAMMADMIPPEKRPDAYALLRISNNLGVAVGPAIGGFIASSSYTVAFLIAAAGMALYGLMIALLAHETLPQKSAANEAQMPGVAPAEKPAERLAGYERIFRDRAFIQFVSTFALNSVCASLMWVLLAVYAKQNFGLPESRYGLIPMTNALMVVFLQMAVTQFTKRRPTLSMVALGALFYAVGVGSVALGRGFWGFWLSMVIMTVGELIITPTSNTWIANRAPADMRGRYMSLYSVTWPVAQMIGPVMGGLLNDNLGPVTIWYGGLVIGLLSTAGFLLLRRSLKRAAAPLEGIA